MVTWTPDPTFYPSPRLATQAPPEKLAYVASFDPTRRRPDAMAVVNLDPVSANYGQIVGQTDLAIGDELHHFGWNACSSCLCPNAPHPHVERRYLIVPGIRSSRLHVLDTKPDPAHPKLIRTIEADELAKRAGYSRPHTVHCGPEGIYISALADAEGRRPGGVFLMDHETFDVRGRWELDRGPQELAYDFWWHLGYDTMVTSEWGTPDMFENGLIPEKILGSEYGHRLHFWDLLKRRHVQEIDLDKEHQLVFELRPAHDPTKAYGFVGIVLCLQDLSSSVFLWHRDGGRWAVTKVISIPAEPAESDQLPPMLKDFKACPPFVTDIDLSVDDQYLYVSCWGTGDFHQYDVSDPFKPKLTGKLRIGGMDHALRIRRPMGRSMVALRWSRSVAMDAASHSPILSTAQSMTNSIPMGSRGGWSRSTPSQRAGSNLINTSSCPGPKATYRTRYASKAGTRPRIPIATRKIEPNQRVLVRVSPCMSE